MEFLQTLNFVKLGYRGTIISEYKRFNYKIIVHDIIQTTQMEFIAICLIKFKNANWITNFKINADRQRII